MIGINLKLLRKRTGKSQEELSSDINLTRSTYSGYENGVAEPSIHTLILIADYYKIDLNTLVRKDFSNFNDKDWDACFSTLKTDVQGKNIRVLTTLVDQNDEELIELIPQKASAGYTAGYADSDYLKVLPTFNLPFLSKNKKYRSFPISGDSMPPVSDGSFVVGEFIQNWTTLPNGTPCIVVTKNEGIVFKIIYNYLKEKESIQLVSTNPIYKPYFVHADEIIEVWKFVNYISSDIPEIKLDEENLKKTLIILQKEVSEIKNLFSNK
jgi:transcriptional regulator with XRE-family HTH domain